MLEARQLVEQLQLEQLIKQVNVANGTTVPCSAEGDCARGACTSPLLHPCTGRQQAAPLQLVLRIMLTDVTLRQTWADKAPALPAMFTCVTGA